MLNALLAGFLGFVVSLAWEIGMGIAILLAVMLVRHLLRRGR